MVLDSGQWTTLAPKRGMFHKTSQRHFRRICREKPESATILMSSSFTATALSMNHTHTHTSLFSLLLFFFFFLACLLSCTLSRHHNTLSLIRTQHTLTSHVNRKELAMQHAQFLRIKQKELFGVTTYTFFLPFAISLPLRGPLIVREAEALLWPARPGPTHTNVG